MIAIVTSLLANKTGIILFLSLTESFEAGPFDDSKAASNKDLCLCPIKI